MDAELIAKWLQILERYFQDCASFHSLSIQFLETDRSDFGEGLLFSRLNTRYGAIVGPISSSLPRHSSMFRHVSAYKAQHFPGLLKRPSRVLTINSCSIRQLKAAASVVCELNPRRCMIAQAAVRLPLFLLLYCLASSSRRRIALELNLSQSG